MRITGGEARGRRILSPKGGAVRPTPDALREALFNILSSVEGLTFLDLFAGTGSVGLEALSRGAARVVFVEKNRIAVRDIARMLEVLDYTGRAEILPADAAAGAQRLSREGRKFDIVFADPPYERDFVRKSMEYCIERDLLAQDGLLVLQRSAREPLILSPQHNLSIALNQERRYGDTVVSFLCRCCEER